MAAVLRPQTWSIYRGADDEIVLTGDEDASEWTMVFEVSLTAALPPFLSITPTIGGSGSNVITIPFTAEETALLVLGKYPAALWRTDSGSRKPMAVGSIYPNATARPVV